MPPVAEKNEEEEEDDDSEGEYVPNEEGDENEDDEDEDEDEESEEDEEVEQKEAPKLEPQPPKTMMPKLSSMQSQSHFSAKQTIAVPPIKLPTQTSSLLPDIGNSSGRVEKQPKVASGGGKKETPLNVAMVTMVTGVVSQI